MDDADIAEELIERRLEDARKAINPNIPKGTQGECQFCGLFFTRLVLGTCARCRDERGLP